MKVQMRSGEAKPTVAKTFLPACASTLVSLGLANALFFIPIAGYLPLRTPRTNFAFQPIGWHGPIVVAMSVVAGMAAINSRKLSTIAAFGLFYFGLALMLSGVGVWSGPAEELKMAQVVTFWRSICAALAFAFQTGLISVYLRWLSRRPDT